MIYSGVLLTLVIFVGMVSASESPSPPRQSHPSDDQHLRVEALPKSVQDMLADIQRLSAKVEPEIQKFGSRFREDVDQAIKRLRDAVQTEKSRSDK